MPPPSTATTVRIKSISTGFLRSTTRAELFLVAPLSVREDVSDTRTQSRADQGSDNSVRSSDTGLAPMRKSLNGIVRAAPGWRCGRDRLDYCPKATVFSTLSVAHLTGTTTGISARWAR